MGIGLELILDGFGLDNPLVGPIPVLMNQFCGLVVVHRMNLTLCVFHIRALYLEIVDKHLHPLLQNERRSQQFKREENKVRVCV